MIFDLFGGVIRSSVAKLSPESVLWRKPMRFSASNRSIVSRPAEDFVAVGDHARQIAGTQRGVVVGHAQGKHGIEQDAADGRLHEAAGLDAAVALDAGAPSAAAR